MTNQKCGRRILCRRNVLLAITCVVLIVTALEYYGTVVDKHKYLFKFVGSANSVAETVITTTLTAETIITNRNQEDGIVNEKWIVITSIADVTENIRRLSLLEDWKIVVVGDKRSPIHWTYPNCTFLNIDAQAQLGYKLFNKLPFNSYARKTLGYLYAIEHGAKFIYDTDDDNRPLLADRLQFDFDETNSGVRVETISKTNNRAIYFNPYAHFGRPDVWPRGLPLQEIQNREVNVRLRLYSKLKTSAIQQGLVDHDPDVDAVYRLTEYGPDHHISFDRFAPPVRLNFGVYAPFNSQNTLFRYNAFWAFYLPTSVAFRVCDIWRGYWALRLLAEIDESLAFYPANAVQYRNAHNYFKDYLDEKALYEQSYSLVDHLHAWKCKNATIRECAVDLARMMSSNNYWSYEDAKGIEIWFDDLERLGYKFPTLETRRQSNINLGYNVGFVSRHRQISDESRNRFKSIEKILNWCRPNLSWAAVGDAGGSTKISKDSLEWSRKLKTMVLVIAIDRSNYGNIPLLQTFYDHWFANIIFCSTFPDDHLSFNKTFARNLDLGLSLDRPFSYISLPKNQIDDGYTCVTRANELGMNADGYIFVMSDLYNFWHPFNATQLICGRQYWNTTRDPFLDDRFNRRQLKNSEENPSIVHVCRENKTEALPLYDASHHFPQPTKMSLLKKGKRREEFCDSYAKDWLRATYKSMQLAL